LESYNGSPKVREQYAASNPHQVLVFMNIFYKYDDKSFVAILDAKFADIQSQISELRLRVEGLEAWKKEVGE